MQPLASVPVAFHFTASHAEVTYEQPGQEIMDALRPPEPLASWTPVWVR